MRNIFIEKFINSISSVKAFLKRRLYPFRLSRVVCLCQERIERRFNNISMPKTEQEVQSGQHTVVKLKPWAKQGNMKTYFKSCLRDIETMLRTAHNNVQIEHYCSSSRVSPHAKS